MSLQQKVHYHTRYFMQFLHSLALPRVLTGWKAKSLVTVVVLIMGFAYIAQTNTLSTSGYVINNLQKEIDDKNTALQKLETKVASYQSMNSIQARLPSVQLVPVEKVSYIQVPAVNQVAER